MSMEMRQITKDDGPILRKLAADCKTLDMHTPYTYWVVCNFLGEAGFVLEEEAKPIGYIMNLQKDHIFFIWQIGILEEYRGRGFAKELIDASVAYAERKGAKEIYVTIAPENHASYRAFANYFQSKELILEKAGNAEITDLVDKEFRECEQIYRIRLEEK